jgi:hypothetical protein
MDDYEFDANPDRLGYQLDCARLAALRARSEYLRLGSAPHSSAGQIATAHDCWQILEQRCHALQRSLAEVRAGHAA